MQKSDKRKNNLHIKDWPEGDRPREMLLEKGTVDRAAVYPRRVMEAAIRRGAAALVFAHNHPNADITPSEHDKNLTRALVLAAATLQIKVHDHLIVSKDQSTFEP